MATVYQRKGSPYFQASITVGGVRRRVSTEETNRRKAQKKADAIEEQENQKLLQSQGLLFSDATARFLKVKDLKPKTKKGYTDSFTNIFGVLGDFALPTLTEEMLTHYIDERMKYAAKKLKTSGMVSIRRDLAFLSTLYTTAKHWEPLIKKHNPAKEYDKKGIPDAKSRTVWLKEGDVQKFIDTCRKPYQMLFIMLAVGTGMRDVEIRNLRWDEIDFDKGEIVLDNLGQQKTKTGKPRIIPLNASLLDTLRVTQETSSAEWVFYNPKTEKPYTTFKTFWGKLRTSVGLKDVRIHDLRHTFASWGRQNGVDEVTLMDIMGHKTRSMVKRYSHSSRESLHQNVKKMPVVTISVTRAADFTKNRNAEMKEAA